MSLEEFDQPVREIVEEARAEAYRAGVEEAKPDHSCPECSGPMEPFGYGEWFSMNRGWLREKGVTTDSTDVWCDSCDLLLDPDTGRVYHGSEYRGASERTDGQRGALRTLNE